MGASRAGAATAPPSSLDARLQAVVEGLTGDAFVGEGIQGSPRAFYVPGATLSVGLLGQATRTYVAGWASLERRTPVRPDQIQPIGSGTKPMTAALVIRLITRGRLRLAERLTALAERNRRAAAGWRRWRGGFTTGCGG